MEGGSEGELSMSQKELPGLVSGPEENGSAAVAREAESLYRSKSYTECLNLLLQLNDSDPKVIHNIAITEFHRDGCTEPKKLLAVLQQVKSKCEELARAADEQLEGMSNTTSSPNGSGTGLPVKPTSLGYMEDYDVSIPSLNIAIVYHHLKQYASALALLEPLFANIEPVDENCALQICLLLLDISLASRRADKAAAVLQYVEKSYGLGQGSAESTGSGQASVPAHTTLPALEARSFSISSTPAPPSPVNSPISESSLAPSGGEENFEEDALSIGLEIDGTHVRGLTTRIPAIEKSHPAPGTDLKLRIHLHRVRYLHLTHALKAAKREVKLALNLSKDNLSALLLKAQLEFSRGNYKKAMKLLATCSSRGEASIAPMILSNQGCVYHYLRKYHLAALLYVKALEGYAALNEERPLKLSTFSRDKSLLVYYNAGLVKLFSGNPVLAAGAFQESAPLFYIKPLFWLRLAECCIAGLEKGLLTDVSPKREQVDVVVIGQERHRRLVLPAGSFSPLPTGETSDNDELRFLQEDGKGGKPVPLSMSLAKKCLNNAFYLLERADTKAEESKESEDGSQSRGGFDGFIKKDAGNFAASLASFEQEQKEEREILKLCVLCNLAFVELCLGNPSRSLAHAEAVLQHGEAARPYSFLSHVYAAEALCLLERLQEAEVHLRSCIMEWTGPDSAEKLTGGESDDGTGEDPCVKFMVERTNTQGAQARASLFVNLAAVHVMSGRLADARQLAVEALKASPGSSVGVLAMVYVEVAQGRSKEAVALLKTCRSLKVSRLKRM